MIRKEHGIGLSRFCRLVGVPRSTYHRWRRGAAGSGRWPTPVLDRVDPLVAEIADAFPAWGHRKVWAMLATDGVEVSMSSVERSMRRQGRLLPTRYQAGRRRLAEQRRAAFVVAPARRNRVWQLDFTEFETLAGGTWQIAPIVDYWAKLCLASQASVTKTTRDAVAALRIAIATAEELLNHPLIDDLVLPTTGEVVPIVVVTDNGSCFKSAGFAAFIASRPELTHVRTRHKAPETNGVVERYAGSLKYERLYREEISDGLDLQAQLDDYQALYNTIRPHQAIDWQRPLDRYLDPVNETKEAKHEPAKLVSKP